MKKAAPLVGLIASLVLSSAAFGCTVFAVGKNASADGTAMISHTCDSLSDHFGLKLIAAADHPAGSERLITQHGVGKAPDEADVPMSKIPEAPHTYRYLTSQYAFINEKGLAMGESTMSMTADDEHSQRAKKLMIENAFGLMNCYNLQEIALERCATAREAVELMGQLVSKYGWFSDGETMPITDGNETWVFEVYGNTMWAAWRVPDDEIFVAANRARLCHLDLTDKANVLAAPDMIDYAVKNGLISPKDANPKDFSPAEVFYPTIRLYSSLREWRALSVFAPSAKLDPWAYRFPLSVKPDKKVTVADLFALQGDWYGGTPFDLSKGKAAGPWGNPTRYRKQLNLGYKDCEYPRAINDYRQTYVQICQVDGRLPDEIKGVVWFGYGAADTTYLTPLWASMSELPALYSTGTRRTPYTPESGWWSCIRVQSIADWRYQPIRAEIHEARTPRMNEQFARVPELLKQSAELINKGDRSAGLELIQKYAYDQAQGWHDEWLKLGDRLFSKYCLGAIDMNLTPFPKEWAESIADGPFVRPDGTDGK